MNKVTSLLLGTLLFSLTLSAQRIDTNWVKQFDRVGAYSTGLVTSLAKDSYFALYGQKYYTFNDNGDSTGAGAADYNIGFPKSLAADANGIYVGGTIGRKPGLAKLDANFDTLWTKPVYETGSTRGVASILLEGNDIYVGGSVNSRTPFVSKLNQMGDTVWTLGVPQSSFSNISSIIKLNDGNFLASGNWDDYPLAIKFDSNGDTIWTYKEIVFISFSQMNAIERSNGELILIAQSKMIVLDANGNEQSVTDLEDNIWDTYVEDDTIYMVGEKDNMPYIESRTMNFDSLASLRLTENISAVNGGGVFHSIAPCDGGGFVTVGRARDSVNITANTWNVKLARINGSTGSTNPGDTSKPTDTTSVIESQLNAGFNLYPNPANNFVNIELQDVSELKIYNSVGQELKFKQPAKQVDVSGLDNGIYFVRAIADNKVYLETLVIRH